MEGTEPDPHQRSQTQYTEYRLEGSRLEDLALYSAIPLEQRRQYYAKRARDRCVMLAIQRSPAEEELDETHQ